ncbi:MAG: cellulase family glycosylhydrolase [Sphingorhabdus sp.]
MADEKRGNGLVIGKWEKAEAWAWHAGRAWMVGCNFTPSTAINQLEMWQAETFDPTTIDTELALAKSVGMNSVRVYLHDLLWAADSEGFARRIDRFLELASARGIGTMLVLFDSCWDPEPRLGPQRAPLDNVHNSGWVQSPGIAALTDRSQHARLETYVREVIRRYANDDRVVAWDIWNEPDNGPDVANWNVRKLDDKAALVLPLIERAFAWAREEKPSQPLTSGVWLGDWSDAARLTPLQRFQLEASDIISFHNYGTSADFEQRIEWLKAWGRPIVCTEFMARPAGSTFEAILPIAQRHAVGAICWGLVRGKTQTHLPWDNWISDLEDFPKEAWFHDIFEPDGTPHDASEVEFIRMMTRIADFAGIALWAEGSKESEALTTGGR